MRERLGPKDLLRVLTQCLAESMKYFGKRPERPTCNSILNYDNVSFVSGNQVNW
jgi:hypothetical protein